MIETLPGRSRQRGPRPARPAARAARGGLVRLCCLATLIALPLAGCDPYGCTSETRFLELQATLARDGGDTANTQGWIGFTLGQWRGGVSQSSISWSYQTPRPNEDVADITIREDSLGPGGDLMYRLTTWGEPPWVPSGLAPQSYVGPLDFTEFFDRLHAGDGHVEVIYRGDSLPALLGRLRVTDFRDWSGRDASCS
jgi:hypothetical protein